MESVIIRNKTNLSMEECVKRVERVIANGRISDGGKSYSYATSFLDGIVVLAVRRKQSDVFNIYR